MRNLLSFGLFVLTLTHALPSLAGNPFGLKKKVRTKQAIKAKASPKERQAAYRKAKKLVLRKLFHERLTTLRKEPGFKSASSKPGLFEKRALEEIDRNPDRYIAQVKLVSEQNGAAELEMEINGGELLRNLALLDRRIALARFPKLMFVVEETYTAQDKKTQTVAAPTLLGVLEDAFLARGFDLVSKEQIEKLKREDAKMFQSLLSKPSPEAVRYATSLGAEYIVTASARIVHTSVNAMGLNAHRGHVALSLRAVDASTGALIDSRKLEGNSPPNCYSESCLKVKAVDWVAPRLVEPFVGRIIKFWDKDTENGIRYTVRLYNVKSKKRQGLRFIELLGKIENVMLVKQLAFSEGRMELEVFYRALYDVSHLEAMVLQAAERVRSLKSIDVRSSRGREVNFHL